LALQEAHLKPDTTKLLATNNLQFHLSQLHMEHDMKPVEMSTQSPQSGTAPTQPVEAQPVEAHSEPAQNASSTETKRTKRSSRKSAAEKTRAKIEATKSASAQRVCTKHPDVLPDEAKRFIVEILACYRRPVDVIAEVKEIFGIEPTRQQLQVYDPTKWNGKRLGSELQQLFYRTRTLYKNGMGDVGITHRRYRLAEYNDLLHRCKDRGDDGNVIEAFQSVEKEMHRAYTHPPKKTPDHVQDRLSALLEMTPEELRLPSLRPKPYHTDLDCNGGLSNS
jgi:hypothetical protein